MYGKNDSCTVNVLHTAEPRVIPHRRALVSAWGWSGCAMVLGKLPVLLIWMTVGQGPTARAVGAGGGFEHFFLVYHFSFLSPSL